jgi:hypothetical protein
MQIVLICAIAGCAPASVSQAPDGYARGQGKRG